MPPANPMPSVDALVGGMRRPGLAPAPRGAAGAGRPPAGLGDMLRNLLASAAAPSQSAPAIPGMAQGGPAAAPSTPLEHMIDQALANPGSEARGAAIPLDTLAGIGADLATLQAVLEARGLAATVLVARPEIVAEAERARQRQVAPDPRAAQKSN